MGIVEVDAESEALCGFDPLTTPYEVEKLVFPVDGTWEEQFTHLLRYVVLAPSSHNTQPWKFQLFEQCIAVLADYSRRLPVTDPNNREMLMGVGAAIMNLRVAAMHFGFACDVHYNHGGSSDMPIAFAGLTPTMPRTKTDELMEKLFFSISKRHTNRRPFLAARVPDSIVARLSSLAQGSDADLLISVDPRKNMQVAHLVATAERIQQSDPEYRKELAEWLRPNKTQKPDGMTGAAFGINDIGSAVAPWAMKTMDFGGFRARHDERLCIEAPALLALYGEDSVPVWLAVGEVLEDILLTLTRDGLQFSFFNMPIELPEARLELRRILGIDAFPQLLLRIGYSLEKPVQSPRRSVEECLVRTS